MNSQYDDIQEMTYGEVATEVDAYPLVHVSQLLGEYLTIPFAKYIPEPPNVGCGVESQDLTSAMFSITQFPVESDLVQNPPVAV